MPSLPPGVRNYEPHLALDGGPGGYVVFDRIIAQAKDVLVPGGHLIVEIGAPQHEQARARIREVSPPFAGDRPLYPDIAALDRLIARGDLRQLE